jgi:MFS family permease
MTTGRARNYAIGILLVAIGVLACALILGGDIPMLTLGFVLAAASMAIMACKTYDE